MGFQKIITTHFWRSNWGDVLKVCRYISPNGTVFDLEKISRFQLAESDLIPEFQAG